MPMSDPNANQPQLLNKDNFRSLPYFLKLFVPANLLLGSVLALINDAQIRLLLETPSSLLLVFSAGIILIGITAGLITRAKQQNQRSQIALLESERRYASLATTVPVGIYRTDPQGKCIYANEKALSLTGLSETEILENGWTQAVHPDDRAAVFASWLAFVQKSAQDTAATYQQGIRFVRPDGSLAWTYTQVVAERNTAGDVIGFVGTLANITEHQAVQRLTAEQPRHELSLLEQILDVILAGYWDWDIPGNKEYLSPGFKRMFGYEESELPNSPETWQQLIFPEDLPGVLNCFERHVQSRGKVPYYNEVRYRHKDGSTVWVICSGQVIEWDADGNPVRMIGCHIDITERQQTQQQLLRSEIALREALEFNQQIVSSVQEGVIVLDRDLHYQIWNPFMTKFVGIESDAVVGKHPLDVFPDFEDSGIIDCLKRSLAGEVISSPDVHLPIGEREIWISEVYSPLRNHQGDIVGVIVTIRDIVERQYAEAALRKSEEQIRLIIDSVPALVAYCDADQRYRFCNHQYAEWLGKEEQDIYGKSIQDVVGISNYQRIQERIQAVLSGQVVTFEPTITRPDGSKRYNYAVYTPHIDADGQVLGFFALIQDQTPRKQAELALKASERRYAALAETSPTGIFRTDLQGSCCYVNPCWCQMAGLSSEDAMGQGWSQALHPDDRERVFQEWYEAARTQQMPYVTDCRFQRPDGFVTWLVVQATEETDSQGQIVGYVGTITDITERKENEAALQFQATVLGQIHDAVIVTDPAGKITHWNQGAENIYGYRAAEAIGQNVAILYFPSDLSLMQTEVITPLYEHGNWDVELPNRHKSGKAIYIRLRLSLLKDADGTVIGMIGCSNDISDRKQAEEALSASEEKFRRLFEANTIGVMFSDLAGGISDANDEFLRIVGYTREDLAAGLVRWDNITPPEYWEADRKVAEQLHQDGTVPPYEKEYRRKDGNRVPVLVGTASLAGEDSRGLAFVLDISDRKTLENAMQSLLAGTAAVTGEAFFPALVDQIANALQCPYVFVSQKVGERLETVAWYAEDGLQDQFSYAIAHTPCEVAISQGSYACNAGVRQAFPLDSYLEQIEADGYLGVALRDRAGQPIGVLCILDRQPLKNLEFAQTLLQIFGARAAAELERLQTRAALEHLNQALEQRVEQRTQELAQSEQDLRTIFNNVYDGIFIHDLDGTILDVNDRVAELFGTRKNRILSSTIAELSTVDAPLESIPELIKQAEAGAQLQFEWKNRRFSDNSTFDSEVALRRVTLGNRSVIVAGVRDISDRKQAEAALKQQMYNEQLLNRVIQVVRSSLDLKTIFARTTQAIAEHFDVGKVAIAQYQPEQNQWVYIEEHLKDRSLSNTLGLEIPDTDNPFAEQLKRFEIVQVNDTNNIEDPVNQAIAEILPGSWLVFPLAVNQKIWGTLVFLRQESTASYSDNELALVQRIADQLSIAIQQAELYRQVQQEREKLRQSKATLAQAQQIAHVGNWELDVATQAITWSDEIFRMFGFDPANPEPAYAEHFNLIHPEDRVQLQRALDAAMTTGTPYEIDLRLFRTDGTTGYMEARGNVIRDEQGQIVKLVGTALDITERKQTEEALRLSREQLQLALEGSGDGLWDWDITTDEVYLSPRWLEMLGYAVGEFPGHVSTWGKLIHPDDEPWVMECLNAHLEDSQVLYAFDYRVRTRSGDYKWVANYGKVVSRDAEGKPLRMVGTHRDISDRKQAEVILRDREERLRLALAAARQGLYDLNLQTGEAIVNSEYAIMLGYDPATFQETNEKWIERLHPDDRESVSATYQAYINGEIPTYKVEFRQRTQDGQWKWILSLGKIVAWDETGQPLRMLGTHTDIDGRKRFEAERESLLIDLARLNRELEQANEQLADYSQTLEQKVEARTGELKVAQERIMAQEKLASLGTLTAGVAHELRNPLNFVKNYAEGSIDLSQDLLETLEPTLPSLDAETADLVHCLIDDLQENAATIRHHSQRVDQIVESMMQHARSDNEHATPQPTTLHSVIDRAIKLAYHSKRSHESDFNLSIQTDYATDIDSIDAIASSLIRAFINLIDNACDAMQSKQHQLQANAPQVESHYKPTLLISTRNFGEQVEICIRDNGCGIAPADRPKILDPFFTTKPPGEGTGLGLSLTHDIITKQHQGTLTLNTELGKFTEFVLRLPYRQEMPASFPTQLT